MDIVKKEEKLLKISEQYENFILSVGLIWYNDNGELKRIPIDKREDDLKTVYDKLGINSDDDKEYVVEWVCNLDSNTPLFPVGVSVK